jgi:hypothetical protein
MMPGRVTFSRCIAGSSSATISISHDGLLAILAWPTSCDAMPEKAINRFNLIFNAPTYLGM